MIPARIAAQNVISKPGTNLPAMYTVRPFTTSVNKPNVNKIAGSDKMIISGFSNAFNNDRIKPAPKNSSGPLLGS